MRLVTDNLVLKSIITSSSVDVHFPLENLKNTLRSKRMRTTSNENQWVLFDIGAIDLGEESAEVSNVDSVVLLLPKEGTITFSGSQIIKIQANDTDVWDNPPVDVNLSLDSTRRQATHYFETPLNYRYWRLTMTDPTSNVDYFEISKVILGQSEQMEPAQNGFKWSNNDNSKVQRNDFGTPYVDVFPKLKTLSLNYNVLTYEEIIKLENIFEKVGTSIPIWVVIDPFEKIFDKDRYSIYGQLRDSFDSNHRNYNIFDSSGLTITESN